MTSSAGHLSWGHLKSFISFNPVHYIWLVPPLCASYTLNFQAASDTIAGHAQAVASNFYPIVLLLLFTAKDKKKQNKTPKRKPKEQNESLPFKFSFVQLLMVLLRALLPLKRSLSQLSYSNLMFRVDSPIKLKKKWKSVIPNPQR